MRVVARGTLRGFVERHVESGKRELLHRLLDDWFKRVSKAEWKSSADLKAEFGSASIVNAQRVVFNIKGNDFRLVVWVNYECHIVRILWLGSHRDYDRIDVSTVTFDRSRYESVSDSD